MKHSLPYNVFRNPNDWANAPRMPQAIALAIAPSLMAAGGVGAFLLTTAISIGISAVTSWALNALSPKPDMSSSRGTLVNARDAVAPADFVYGEVRKGGIITFYESNGDENKYLHQVIVVAAHEVEEIGDIYINDQVATWSASTGLISTASSGGDNQEDDQTDWAGKIRIRKHLGDQTTADSELVSETSATSTFIGKELAYLYVRYEYDQDVFANGLPLITVKVKGKKVYDPRDQTTAYSNNAALCIRDFIKSTYGLGDNAIDEVSFAAAAHESDEPIALSGEDGGSEPRFTINGVVRASESIGSVLGNMSTACAGTIFWGSGYWKLKVGTYNAPVKTLTLDDLRGPINLQTRVSIRDNFNTVRGTFNDAAQNYITADYPEFSSDAFKAEDKEEEVSLDLPLPFTTSASAAQRIAKLTLFRGREQMTISADFGLEAFGIEVGDIIAFDNPRYGFDEKEFEVTGWNFAANQDAGDLRVTLTLRETSSAAFDWDAEESDIIGNNTTLPVYTAGLDILGLSVGEGGRTQSDGTRVSTALLGWTAVQSSYVTQYEVQWKPTSDSSYATTYTTNNSIELSPIIDSVEYTFRVRAVSANGYRGPFSSLTLTGAGDTTPPADPTSLSATGTLGFINISWVNPADPDFNFVEVWESADNNLANAVEIARAFGSEFNRGNLAPLTTRYYWVRAVDYSNNKSGFVGPEFASTNQITAGDIGPAVIGYDNFAGDVTTLFDDIEFNFGDIEDSLADRVLVSDYNITVDYQQQLEDATTQLSTDALTLALNASSLESRINDAGITVDPEDGSVTIQGLSAVEDRVNEVEIDLDAVEGELTLKATTTYVNNAIAAATLPEATLESLEELEARVGTVAIDLDAVEGSITLTSTGSYYDVNDGVLGVEALEGRITVNEGQISLKATQSDLDDVGDRLGTAEVTLNALDVPSINLAVQDVRTVSEKQDDLSELTLQEVLGRYNDREYILQDVAYARQSLTADVNEQREAVATLTTELAAEISDNQASILSEQQARADADGAIASDLTQLNSQVNDPVTGLPAAQSSIVTLNETKVTAAEATSIAQSEITSSLTSEEAGTIGAEINTLEETKVTADQATSIAQSEITSSLTSEEVGTIGASIKTLEETKVTAAEATSIAQSEITSSLTSEEVGTIGASINALESTKVTAAEATSIAQSEITSSLTSEEAGTIGASINTLEATKVTAEGAVAAVNTEIGAEYDGISGLVTVTGEAKAGVDGLETKYGVQIDNNGSISGYQLLSGVGGSAFNVRADQFAVFNSTGAGGDNPFTVFTSSRNIGGVVYPAGTYIENAYIDNAAIVNGSITNAKIANAAITDAKIDDLAVTNAKIRDLAVTTGKIGNLSVNTLKIADQAVSNTAFASGSVSLTSYNTWTNVASIYFSTEGSNQLIVQVSGTATGYAEFVDLKGYYRILVGGSVIYTSTEFNLGDGGGGRIYSLPSAIRLGTSSASATSVVVQARRASGQTLVPTFQLLATELKK